MKYRSLILVIGSFFLFSGCSKTLKIVDCNGTSSTKKIADKENIISPIKSMKYENQECVIENGMKKSCLIKLEVSGVGVVPTNALSVAQAKVMARRAAILDGYRALTEKMYGIQINGRDTVKNMILQNSSVRGYVEGLIRGADIEEEEFKDGVYTVTMSVKLNIKRWNQYLKNNNIYATNGDYGYVK